MGWCKGRGLGKKEQGLLYLMMYNITNITFHNIYFSGTYEAMAFPDCAMLGSPP